jgi:hypothetical protein
MSAEREKLTETFSMKITTRLKTGYDQLNAAQKFRLQERLKYEMARAIHEALFDPKKYL